MIEACNHRLKSVPLVLREMKAGSLQWMTISVLCESPRDRHLRRSVPRSVLAPHARCARGDPAVRGIVLSAFIYFLARSDLNSEISNLKSFGVFEFEI